MITDKELLLLLCDPKGQERGFKVLMQTYGERLYWHLRQMLTWHEAADEVLQNVWVKVFKGVANFRGDSQLFTWLYRIATNEALSFLNKKKLQTQPLDDSENGIAQQLKADTFFDGEEAEIRLQAAIAILPPKQKQVFCMRYYDELSYKEMSEMLQTSEGALKASYHHAIKKIEEAIMNS